MFNYVDSPVKSKRQRDLDAYIRRKRARKSRLEATTRSEAAASFLLLNNDVLEAEPEPEFELDPERETEPEFELDPGHDINKGTQTAYETSTETSTLSTQTEQIFCRINYQA